MSPKPHIVFAGGGTAGHLFPGLAVAARMRQVAPGLRVTFIGSGKSFERNHVAAAGFEYLSVPCRPLPRSPRETFAFVADNLAGYYAARWFLRHERASVVVGLGGYVSVPAARAALRLRIPLALIEQNAAPGRATRWLARRAQRIFAGWSETRSHLRSRRLAITGVPIRGAVIEPGRLASARSAPPRLTVLGGSGGSQTLNEHVPPAIYNVGPLLAGWEIVHQTGGRDVAATTALYRKLGLAARVTPFLDDLPAVLTATELAISRAGGSTLAELAAAGTPSILLPYPRATDDHQRRNAEIFLARGACRLLDEREETSRLDNRLARELRLAGDRALRRQMGSAARRLARPDAAAEIADSVLELAGWKPKRAPLASAA